MGIFSNIFGRKEAKKAGSRLGEAPVFENLEQRILLSADCLISNLNVSNGSENLLYDTNQVIEYENTQLSNTNELVENRIIDSQPEIISDDSSDSIYESEIITPLLSFTLDENDQNNETEKAGEKTNISSIENAAIINTEQDNSLQSNASIETTNSKVNLVEDVYIFSEQINDQNSTATTKDCSKQIINGDIDLSIQYAAQIEIRGPPTFVQTNIDQILFIDSTINFDFQLITAVSSSVQVVTIPVYTNSIQFISETLSHYSNLSAIHIFSHGASGQLSLGDTILDMETMEYYAVDLTAWGNALSDQGDLLIYGCSIGAGQSGQAWVNTLAELTGADVAASDDLTGAADMGGDWIFEQVSGSVETETLELTGLRVCLGTVTTTADELTSNGQTSLREAVKMANSNSGSDTINLGAGIYTLSLTGTLEDNADTGDLDLTDTSGTLTIKGAGKDQTFIDGGDIDRVFHILSNVRVIFEDLTIRNGLAKDSGSIEASTSVSAKGGGLLIESGADVTLKNVKVIGNEVIGAAGEGGLNGKNQTGRNGLTGGDGGTGEGGGIYNKGILTIQNGSTIESNTAYGGGGGGGGGADYFSSGDTGYGGYGGDGGDAVGGGVYSTGTVYADSTAFFSNSAIGGGGGGSGGGGMAWGDRSGYNGNPDDGSPGNTETTIGLDSNDRQTVTITSINEAYGGRGGDGYMVSKDSNFRGGNGGAPGQNGQKTKWGRGGGYAGTGTDPQIHGTYVDETAPNVTSVDVPANGTYSMGQNMDFIVFFNEPVTIDTSGGTPSISIYLESDTVQACLFGSVSDSTSATFRYTVQAGDYDYNSISLGTIIHTNGSTIRDGGGNDSNIELNNKGNTDLIMVDAVGPEIQSVSVPVNDTYGLHEVLEFIITFEENITIDTTNGSPAMSIIIGTTTVEAELQGLVNDQTTATFSYTIEIMGLYDMDGIQVDILTLNGSTIRDSLGNDADTTFNNIGDTSGVFVDSLNDEPSIANLAGDSLDYNEGDGAMVLEQGSDIVVSDPDSESDFEGGYALIYIVSGAEADEDILSICNQGTGSGQIGFSGSVVTYEGNEIGTVSGGSNGNALRIDLSTIAATPEAVAALIENITYENSNTSAPSLTQRIVRFVLNDGDGTTGGGDDTSQDYDVTVNLTGDNDPLVVENLNGDNLTYYEGDGVVLVDVGTDATVSDPEQQDFIEGGTLIVSLVSGGVSIEDQLGIQTDTLINISGNQVYYNTDWFGTIISDGKNGNDLTVVFDGDVPALDYVEVLIQHITFENTDVDHPTVGDRTVRFVLNDADGTENGGSETSLNYDVLVHVVQVNDTPINTVPGMQTVDEDTDLIFSQSNGNAISIFDIDVSGATMIVILTSTNGTLTAITGTEATLSDNGTDQVTIEGTLDQINAALDGLSYQGNHNFNGQDILTVTTNDQGHTGVDPGLTGDATSEQDEDTVTIEVNPVNDVPTISLQNTTTSLPENTDTSSRIKVSDIIISDDEEDANNLSLSGADAASFEIDGLVLYLKAGTSLDYETKQNFYVTVAVDDTTVGASPDDTVDQTLIITDANDSPNAVDDVYTTDEDTSVTTGNVLANDTDADISDTLTLTGFDTSATKGLVINNGDGTFDYNPNGQFDYLAAEETTTDTFKYTVSDSHGSTDTATVTITITGVNDDPTAFDDSFGNVTNQDTAITIDNVLVNDTDPDISDVLSVHSFDTTSIKGGLVTNNGNGTFGYDPNGQFDNLAAGDTATDTFTYTISDGHEGKDSAIVTITITGLNDSPNAVDDTCTTDEDTPVTTGNVLANDTDPDIGDTLTLISFNTATTLGVVTNNGDGTFDYNPNGQFDYLAAGETTTDTFKYTISDSHGSTDTATVTITITGVNDAPTNIDLNNVTVHENQPVNTYVGTFTTTDADANDTHTYTLVDTTLYPDNDLFTISGDQLLTAEIFDYEIKNTYTICVRTNDSKDETYTDVFTITIIDVNETPTVSLTNTAISFPEDTDTTIRLKVADITVTDDALGTNILSLTGDDALLFEIDSSVLYLKAGTELDYETNPVLDVTVQVDDATIGSTPDDITALSIAVTDINEHPTDITLSNNTVDEHTDTGLGYSVGILTTTDPDTGDTASYSIVGGADQINFSIGGLYSDELILTDGILDYEIKSSYEVTVEVTDSGSLTYEETFTISVNDLIEEYHLSSTDVPQKIVDFHTIYSSLTVSGLLGTISDVNVQLDITHTWNCDLTAYLINPNGTRVELFTYVGSNGGNFNDTVLDDEAVISIDNGLAPFTGSYRPEGLLSVLDGINPNGTWQLEITDHAYGDYGRLNSWELIIQTIQQPEMVVTGNNIPIADGDTTPNTNDCTDFSTLDPNSNSVTRTFTIYNTGSGTLYLTGNPIVAISGSSDFTIVAQPDSTVLPGESTTFQISFDPTSEELQTAAVQIANNDTDENPYDFLIQGIGNAGVWLVSSDVPKAIRDNNTTVSPLFVNNQTGVISDIDVYIDITHQYNPDLDVYLISPQGTSVELFTDVNDRVGKCGDFRYTVLDNQAAESIVNSIVPNTGIYRPEGNLSAFNGENPNGIWRLEITDDEYADIGVLNTWALRIKTSYKQDFESGLPGASDVWEYYSSNEGRIQAVDGRLRLDDYGDNWSYSLNEAILHVNLTNMNNVMLTLDHVSLADENTALPENFTGHYNGDGIALSVDGVHWVRVTSLTTSFTGQSFELDDIIEQAKTAAGSTDVSYVRIKLQQYDNTLSPNDGREFDNIQVDCLAIQNVPYTQNFSTGKPDVSQGWEYYSNNQGQIQVIDGHLRMDDYGVDYNYSLNEAILHLDLTGKTDITLTLDHTTLYDENTALPANFTGHYNGDGIVLSVDGIHWVRITSLTTSFTGRSFALDSIIAQAKTVAGITDVSNVRIKFQQFDNTNGNDGREFDNIQITTL